MDGSFEHPETLEETPPAFLVEVWNRGTDLLVAYGWYFLAVTLIVTYYWETIQSKLDKWYEDKSNKEYAAKCKKDPDALQRKQEEMEAARKRMQEELNAKAALHAVKMEEKKRAEVLASPARDVGHTLGDSETSSPPRTSTTSTTTKKSFRPEYNPLMGSGGSGGYRPTRRGCPGGGCG